MIDVFYLTYYEDYSQENFDRIKSKCGKDQIVTNVADIDGIFNGHLACALASSTTNFYVVDGDAWIVDDFDFSYIPSDDIDVYPSVPQTRCTHVWRASNPATGELAGYGGVKLFNKNAFLVESDEPIIDVTTTVAKRGFPYHRIDIESNETRFENTPFNAWKGAFRECVKLASGVATDDIQQRLLLWKNPIDNKFKELLSLGAEMGEKYGNLNRGNPENLTKINDWEWLETMYEHLD
jgi:hypothetical protein